MNKLIPFQLTIISAHLKKNANIFKKMRAYTVVSLLGGADGRPTVTTKTPVDKHRGENPVWSSTMKLQLEETKLHGNFLMLVFQVRCKQTLGTDKNIGLVYVPIKELFETSAAAGQKRWRNAAFCVTSRSGKAKGILYVAYRFGEGSVRVKKDNAVAASTCAEPSAPPMPAGDSTEFVIGEGCFPEKPIPSAPYLEDDIYINY